MKFFSIDNLIMTLMVFVVLRFLPIIFQLDFLDPIQNTFQDFQVSDMAFTKLRDYSSVKTDTNIVLVNVGNFNRREIAGQLDIISRYKPKVVGIDIRFIDDKGSEMDEPLMDSFSKIDNLVLATKLDEPINREDNIFGKIEMPHVKFQKNAQFGFANLILSEKGFNTIRTFTPKASVNGKEDLFFPVKVAHIFDSKKTQKLLLRDRGIEIVNYRRNADKYRIIDAIEIFQKKDSLDFIRNKIVLLGFLGPNLATKVTEDMFFTSMNEKYVGKTLPDMYGLIIHANVISMILANDYCERTPYWASVLYAFIICYFNLSLFSIMRNKSDVLYEGVNFILIITELFFFLFLILYVFYWLGYEISILADFFPILLCPVLFETYQDSLKPLGIEYYRKIKGLVFNKFLRKQ